MEKHYYYPLDKLKQFEKDVFQGIGVPEDEAEICADVLNAADARGIDSHGAGRLKPIYYDRIVNTKIQNALTKFDVERDVAATAVVNGNNGMGFVVAKKCMDMAIEKARLHQEEVRRQQIENEMAVGRQIQLSLLPKGCPTLPGWNCAATYQPANQVGGDFYDFFDLPDGRWGIVVADVSGEGVPAALFMALSRTMVRSTALSGASPAEALIRASDLIRKDSRSDLFVTVFYGVLDPHSGKMVYANAGHNRPLVLEAATGAIGELDARGIVLGVLEKVELEEKEVTIAPGDLLVYYTDGITEAVNGEKQIFGRKRLRAVVAAQRTAGAQQAVDAILAAVSAFCGDAPQSDDRTLVALKRGG